MLTATCNAQRALDALRSDLTYGELCARAEQAVLNLLESAKSAGRHLFLNSFTQTTLWLAAHRLEKAGKVRMGITNAWELSEKK